MPITTIPGAATTPTTARTDPAPGASTPPTAPPDTAVEVTVAAPPSPDQATRTDVGRKAAEKLVGVVDKYKDVAGTGQESAAVGDPRITERRNALSTLIAEKSGSLVLPALFDTLGANVAADIQWLRAADRSDYKVDGGSKQFDWAKSDMTGASKLEGEFKRRVTKGRERAKAIEEGKARFLDVGDASVIGLSMIGDPTQRANALMDALLQFRGRLDQAKQKEVGWGDDCTRADQVAPALIAEQRIVLAGASFDPTDMAKTRDYALLREVIASHPTSSVNGIFEARNAIGKIYLDGFATWGNNDHPMAWIRTEVPPGGSASAYAAIHHNFSRDTPGNVAAAIREWVFPQGPAERREALFLALTDAILLARGGDSDGARAALGELSAKDRATIKPLLDQLAADAGVDVATAITQFIEAGAQKPISGDRRQIIAGLAKKAADNPGYSWECRRVREALAGFGEPLATQLKPLLDAIKDVSDDKLGATIQKWLDDNPNLKLANNAEINLGYLARTYRCVCQDQPSVKTLERDLFKAGDAWPEVADVIARLAAKDDLGTLKELGEARLAMRDAIVAAKTGYERQELIRFDAQLSRLTCTELGSAVDRVGDCKSKDQRSLALLAVQTALRSAVASGLHAIRDLNDPASSKGPPLDKVLADVDAAVASGKVSEEQYRGLMCAVYRSTACAIQNMRSYADARAADVASGGAQLDPMFMDQFVKQSPLHYASALAQKGMRVGLKEKITPRSIENVEGMRVLNSIGPVVFSDLVFAENSKQLAEMGTTKDQLAVLYKLEEKKMVAVGGLMVDTANAPGGNSHLNMYAMNNGIPVVALPELRTRYAEFFANAEREGGVYIDDKDGSFRMMTLGKAVEEGLLPGARVGDDASIKAAVEKMRPGVNREITFLKPTTDAQGWEVMAKHDAIINDDRITRVVEIYSPQEEVAGIGRGCPTWKELAKLGTHARHLAGEKGTVLALLSEHPVLGKYVPGGSQITPGDIRDMLRVAKADDGHSLAELWDAVWTQDPKVGIVTDDNYLQSAFYTDAAYRAATRQKMQDLTRDKLEAAFIDVSGDPPKLTAEGEKMYRNLIKNPALAESETGSIIFRSSFTGEDRPGKSGAGQYESYVDRKMAKKIYGQDKTDEMFGRYVAARAKLDEAKKGGDATAIAAAQAEYDKVRDAHIAFMGPARLKAAIGVIESTWMPEPIENNVAEGFFLKYIGPTVAVQDCLAPDISGVTISRDVESGGRGLVTAQIVKGFGGGVDGGKTTEAVIGAGSTSVHIVDGSPASGNAVTVQGIAVSDQDMQTLRTIVLETEKFFHEKIEPGKGYAVDMEVARHNGEWKVVQARVIMMDK
ncbi:MAG: hypothetical protein JXR83_23300 [Deltaproteobacteria bacterium]|nr:hypothetical protein [Deltaproteobacteria bacterium]